LLDLEVGLVLGEGDLVLVLDLAAV